MAGAPLSRYRRGREGMPMVPVFLRDSRETSNRGMRWASHGRCTGMVRRRGDRNYPREMDLVLDEILPGRRIR